MSQLKWGFVVLAAIALAGTMGCTSKEKEAAPAEGAAVVEEKVAVVAEEPLKPLPELGELNMEKVALGRKLFHDTILSGDGTLACSTCHTLDHGGAEPRKTSKGIRGQLGPINSPTVLNSSLNFVQFWDGRARDLREQAEGPVANPIEMGATWEGVVKRLEGNAKYVAEFKALYEDGITKNNITDAIAVYEEALITPSRFDKYLMGDQNAITDAEKKGYETFKAVGCPTCHNGVLIGGGMFQKMGLVNDYFKDRGTEVTEADLGRFNVSKNPAEKHFFKVPTLRNVELTPPYLHDGSRATLEETVRVMGKYQLGRDLTEAEINSIVTFLKSLTGELPPYARLPGT
ncbi:MAG: cytochrome-c peroxidase [Myxococcales bacterium]|nr:cytochrome-c peroxidase [Myxococcales bacterium]